MSGLPGITGGTEQLTYGSPDAGKDHRGLVQCGSLGVGFRNTVAGILWTATGAKLQGGFRDLISNLLVAPFERWGQKDGDREQFQGTKLLSVLARLDE
jgi:hypothetical protein